MYLNLAFIQSENLFEFILSYLILSYLILSYLILSYLILYHCISSDLISSYLISSYLISLYLILSYLILSYLILSYLILYMQRDQLLLCLFKISFLFQSLHYPSHHLELSLSLSWVPLEVFLDKNHSHVKDFRFLINVPSLLRQQNLIFDVYDLIKKLNIKWNITK